MPVMIAARLGAQTGAVVNAFVKRTASLANLSSTGVRASGSPYAPRCGLMSSFEIQTIFGLVEAAGGCCATAEEAAIEFITAAATAIPTRLKMRRWTMDDRRWTIMCY